jgi:hypothetical protein
VLKRVYGVQISPDQVEAEVNRINQTSRAPDVLAELVQALGNDPARFARTVAQPLVVERELRGRFENDDALHAAQRREIERAREKLLAARSYRDHDTLRQSDSELRTSDLESSLPPSAATNGLVERLVAILKAGRTNAVSELTWQLGPRPAGARAPTADSLDARKPFPPSAHAAAPPVRVAGERELYFDDLPPELQRVLRAQLRQPGDLSAVIEMSGGFLLYVVKEKTPSALTVAALSLPKRSFQQWLEEQAKSP